MAAKVTPLRQAILDVLSNAGGSIDDRSGFATRIVRERLPDGVTMEALREQLKVLEHEGFIERIIDGRRTYRVALTPKAMGTAPPLVSVPSDGQALDRVLTLNEDVAAFLGAVVARIQETSGVDLVDALRSLAGSVERIQRCSEQLAAASADLAATASLANALASTLAPKARRSAM